MTITIVGMCEVSQYVHQDYQEGRLGHTTVEISFISSSSSAMYKLTSLRPTSVGVRRRESPSKIVFSRPGTCCVCATWESRCTDSVVKTILLRRAMMEFTRLCQRTHTVTM